MKKSDQKPRLHCNNSHSRAFTDQALDVVYACLADGRDLGKGLLITPMQMGYRG